MEPYTEDFYKGHLEGARQSARTVIPIVLELVKPGSVLDVGCGLGTWLSVFSESGIEDIMGMDGDWVDEKMLQIPKERFKSTDLAKPFDLERQFDLVVSLEVAEHLPSEAAGTFVKSLARHGHVVLFSAAIPSQGGTHHINEQWPDYWVGFFEREGFIVIDPIRRKIWNNDSVEFWYAQNTLMFVNKDYLAAHPILQEEVERTNTSQLSIVHPKQHMFSAASDITKMPIRHIIMKLPVLLRDSRKKR